MQGIIDRIRSTLIDLGLEEVRDVAMLVASSSKEEQASTKRGSQTSEALAAGSAPAPSTPAPETLPQSKRRFLLRTHDQSIRLRVGRPLDLEADAVIYDRLLGTLGLVHILRASGATANEARLEEAIQEQIDKATYLRHLVLENLRPGEPQQASDTPCAVELVFVIPPATRESSSRPPTSSASGALIGKVVRERMSLSTFLHAVGINVWNLETADDRARSNVRRAFSWLLCDTLAWHESTCRGANAAATAQAGAPTPSPSLGELKEIVLHQFRVPGRRKWRFKHKQEERLPLHLVHGPNGSGKSALAEAVELAVTHQIERLENQNHAKVVTNSAAWLQRNFARIEITFASGQILLGMVGRNRIRWKSEQDGIAECWPRAIPCAAAAVRMDQKLADSLSQSLPQRRAQILLSAFFSDEYRRIREEKSAPAQAGKLAAELLMKLPEAVRPRFLSEKGQLDPERVLKELAWLDAQQVKWDKFLDFAGLTPDALAALENTMEPSLRSYLASSALLGLSEAEAAAKTMEEGLQKLLADSLPLKPHIEDAIQVLDNYGQGLAVARRPAMTDPVRHFNEWLELVALIDLLEKEHLSLAAIEQAASAGYCFGRPEKPLLAGDLKSPDSGSRQATLKRLREEARQQIQAWGETSAPAETGMGSFVPIELLNPESLDKIAAAGLLGPQLRTTDKLLSVALREALRERAVQHVQSDGTTVLHVGESNWGVDLGQQARRLAHSIGELANRRESFALSKLLLDLRRLRQAAETLTSVSRAARQKLYELLGEDGPLAKAVNELVALLTPARWAYEDMVSRLDLEGPSETLEYQARDRIPTALRLNTAELNTLALAMFLLCARQSPNPLRLIVLDDPLQNMDELTVTTVARGLGKIMRLWQEWDQKGEHPWRVVLLLHGEENVERIRVETPCVTHLLSWLSPDQRSDVAGPEVTVNRQESLLSCQLQALDKLIQPAERSPNVPRSRGSAAPLKE